MSRREAGFLVDDQGREILSGAPPVGEQGGVPVDATGARAVVLQGFDGIGNPGTVNGDPAVVQADLDTHKVDANAHPQIQSRITQLTSDLITHEGDPSAHPQIQGLVTQVSTDLSVHANDQHAHNIDSLLSGYVPTNTLDTALHPPTLDATGKLKSSQMPATGAAPSATSTTQGLVRLTGDFGGTADNPLVVTLAQRLLNANNLSDLLDIAVARANLGLGTAATRDVPATGNASATQVVLGNDSRLTAGGNFAPLVSPNFSGTPTVPTAPADTNTSQAASTAFVLGQAGTTAPPAPGTASAGTSTRFARADHVHPQDPLKAPLASPAFTGTPTVPTAPAGTNTTQAASTAFVESEIAAGNFVASSNVDQVLYLSQAAWATTTPQAGWVYLVPVGATTVTQPNVLTDNFTRTLASAWTDATNHADTGQDWTAGGGSNATQSVNGNAGLITITVAGGSRIMYVPLSLTTQIAQVRFSASTVPTTSFYTFSVLTRFTTGATSQFYRAKVTLNLATSAMALAIERQSPNTSNSPTAPTSGAAGITLTGVNYAANDQYWLKFETAPSATAGTTDLKATVWKNGTTQPTDPQVTATDTDAALTGAAGTAVYATTTGTAAPLPVFSVHEMSVNGS